MPSIREITRVIEELAPLSLQEEYDNSGLLYGNPDSVIQKVLLCLDCTEAVIDEAIEKKCELVIAHHPIVFRGLKKINGTNYVERTLIKAIQNQIAIYACHTNLDNRLGGVNSRIAEKLRLTQTRILSPYPSGLKQLYTYVPVSHVEKVREALAEAGAGRLGQYDHCSFSSAGTGSFRAGEEAQPFTGKKGELHLEAECRLEMIYPPSAESRVLKALYSAHPYEEPAFGIHTIDVPDRDRGAGLIGEWPEAISAESFLKRVKEKMKTPLIRYAGAVNKPIRTVALCGGAGSFLLKKRFRPEQ
ncbi:MAG TPA: Nif3-like dinuclear metal center hexameric protein, partial [Chitinophagaceae bacterium]|nr:Nif3-like dinuclear metal center hexameric protein [Chitinophagaceae bacterium]